MAFSLSATRWGFLIPAFAKQVPCLTALALGLAACSPQTPTAPPGANAPAESASPAAGGGATLSISGAGATAPNPVYQRWFQEYNKLKPTVQISYDSVGSGAGVKRFLDQTVDFGATDAVLKPDERSKLPADRGSAIQVPTTGLFVVFAYNLDGVDNLKLSREAFCGIADGSIKTWNDPKIAKDNAGVTLPGDAITFVHRSDGSGTTDIFTKHLVKACPNWKAGSGKTVEWPAAGTGAKGNEGVAASIQQTKGAIGYTEFSFAKQTQLKTATLQNKAGAFIAPTPEAAAKALEGETVPADFALQVPDPAGKEAYPIVSLTWMLLYEQPKDAAKAKEMAEFLRWSVKDGKQYATELGYIPLPDELATKVSATLDTIKVSAK
ncbi:phosphate ABC transporter substrate-binding protein PstS [Phormidesmis priestleyi ULC007]|uniref:Phosphate-binding protein n=1 Tax=Phormidesmis priestleyi ULC007 TaxID=1920490 RepID=A0A2T1D861_9CYAN|nr:phosphate ABC transporter substrate-binding protein PstS [Phormidesmis priestleyi]PSB16690.1 phosphate ABC transporter substrate-binding protein PstS [Phormidesmis priestleyi ULC007]PZO47609.1 MAG: phosphate ABC transporter substrate-binding protein PstS [Phormidesmis priestleyi]